ncbi:MAG: hypothetical protein L6Q78_07935 [Bacteroidia bacterium]|nr:hypothetical protein [Bacteroidia bacterium]
MIFAARFCGTLSSGITGTVHPEYSMISSNLIKEYLKQNDFRQVGKIKKDNNGELGFEFEENYNDIQNHAIIIWCVFKEDKASIIWRSDTNKGAIGRLRDVLGGWRNKSNKAGNAHTKNISDLIGKNCQILIFAKYGVSQLPEGQNGINILKSKMPLNGRNPDNTMKEYQDYFK